MCFAWISEQTAIISLYSINLPVFITKAEGFLRGTNWIFKSDRYSFVLKGLKACMQGRDWNVLCSWSHASFPAISYEKLTLAALDFILWSICSLFFLGNVQLQTAKKKINNILTLKTWHDMFLSITSSNYRQTEMNEFWAVRRDILFAASNALHYLSCQTIHLHMSV